MQIPLDRNVYIDFAGSGRNSACGDNVGPGSFATAAGTVPEPTSLGLLIAGMLAM